MADRVEMEPRPGAEDEPQDQVDVLSGELQAQRLAARLGLEYVDLEHFDSKRPQFGRASGVSAGGDHAITTRHELTNELQSDAAIRTGDENFCRHGAS